MTAVVSQHVAAANLVFAHVCSHRLLFHLPLSAGHALAPLTAREIPHQSGTSIESNSQYSYKYLTQNINSCKSMDRNNCVIVNF